MFTVLHQILKVFFIDIKSYCLTSTYISDNTGNLIYTHHVPQPDSEYCHGISGDHLPLAQ